MIVDEQLNIEHHLGFYKHFLTGEPGRDEHWYQEAQYMHSLAVSDAIRDAHIDASILGQEFTNPDTNVHLRFGVARRTKFIWLSLRGLIGLASPKRIEPMLNDQVEEVARDLNVIYINIRGTLYNFAWSLIDLFGTERARKLQPMKVNLFGNDFLKMDILPDLAEFMGKFSEWNKELSNRRDPAAHRIPLSVPPAIIDQKTREEFDQASREYSEAFSEATKKALQPGALARFEQVEVLYDKLQRIGKFWPVFVHHPQMGTMPIYPTVPQDIGQLVRITRGISDMIRKQGRSENQKPGEGAGL